VNEKLFEMLEERLGRMEDKLDKVVDGHGNRLTRLESQAGFVKWSLGALGAILMAIFSWALKKISA
jgi:hypothetical protein